MTAGRSAKGDDGWRVDTFDEDFKEYTRHSAHNGQCHLILGTSLESSGTHKDR